MKNAKIKSTLLKALRDAGKVLGSQISKRQRIEKKSELSIVTETDKRLEKIIVTLIRKNFPNHSILAEESGSTDPSPARGGEARPASGRGGRWIIDPLDGTTNFAHGFPMSCVSIGFEEAGQLKMGGVYDPFRGELFFAEKGKGAFMNGKKIHVSRTAWLSEALLSTGFPYDRRERMDDYLPIFRAFKLKVQGLRRTGSAAMDLCYVACGRFDGYWEMNLQPWDKAAGMLILEEAGGQLTDFSGKPLGVDTWQNAVSNRLIHKEMLQVLKPFAHLSPSKHPNGK